MCERVALTTLATSGQRTIQGRAFELSSRAGEAR